MKQIVLFLNPDFFLKKIAKVRGEAPSRVILHLLLSYEIFDLLCCKVKIVSVCWIFACVSKYSIIWTATNQSNDANPEKEVITCK